jgi:DNA polymerase III epsilon subunit-like protein
MSYIVVDVESDNPSPSIGSMVCFGAVLVSDITKTFYGETKPINDNWDEKALSISGFSRKEHENFEDPEIVMEKFDKWIKEVSIGNPIFISDNPAFDWQWINYYFYKYLGKNPFGFSARRIGDLYCGMKFNVNKNREWKKFRKSSHDHNPVNDAKGNAEALLTMKEMGLKINF